MKNILFTIIIFSLSLNAQNDPRAEKLLAKVSNKIDLAKSYKIDFKYTLENKLEGINQDVDGTVTIQGDNYLLNFMGITQICDSNNIYSIVPENEEVIISSIEEEEEQGMNFNHFLDLARKLIEEKNYKLAEFYVTLAILEPKCDIISKIKSIGILTFVRVNYKDSQLMDYLTFKIEKYLKNHSPSKFEFNNVFCMIRVFYRTGIVKLGEEDIISSLFFFRRARSLFEEGKVDNEESSQRTITTCFEDTVEKFRKEVKIIFFNIFHFYTFTIYILFMLF
jgi:outer membrane lipoprotein-sorting protein